MKHSATTIWHAGKQARSVWPLTDWKVLHNQIRHSNLAHHVQFETGLAGYQNKRSPREFKPASRELRDQRNMKGSGSFWLSKRCSKGGSLCPYTNPTLVIQRQLLRLHLCRRLHGLRTVCKRRFCKISPLGPIAMAQLSRKGPCFHDRNTSS